MKKRLGILHQLFRYAVLNENICTGKVPSTPRGSNFRDDADLGRVLRVGTCDPYVSRSIPAVNLTRSRPTPLHLTRSGLVAVAQAEQKRSTSMKLFQRSPESAKILTVNIRVPLESKDSDLTLLGHSELRRMDDEDTHGLHDNDVHGWIDDSHSGDALTVFAHF